MKLKADDDSFITVKTYYCNDAPETIVSPTDVCLSAHNNFTAWEQYSDTSTGLGHLKFYTRTGLGTAKLTLAMINGLWYTKQNMNEIENWTSTPTIRKMTIKAEYELWHQYLGHAGEKVMANIHKCVDGVPELSPSKHPFRKCECCMKGKIKSAPKLKTTNTTTTMRGQQFHMDFGFVRGSAFKTTNDKGQIITSRDGYNSYITIQDTLGCSCHLLNTLLSKLWTNFLTGMELEVVL